MLGFNPWVGSGDFFITETYLTAFVSNIFYLSNFLFDPVDAPEVPHGAPGVKGDPKVIVFITAGL